MGRSQNKTKNTTPNDILEISDEEEEEVKKTKFSEKQDRTTKPIEQSTIGQHRTPTGKSKYFPSNQKTNYDVPDELKLDSISLQEETIPTKSLLEETNNNGKRMVSIFNKSKTSLSDDDSEKEDHVPITKKKKPNKPEKEEPILISSIASEVQSIPDEEVNISKTPEKTKDKTKGNKIEKTEALNVDVVTTTPPKKDLIDIKIEKWRDESKEISETHRISCNNLFEEIIDDLQKEWALKEENKSRFKQGLELAGKLMTNDSQKARLFYITLSYYILFENKNIQLILNLYDPLEVMDNPLRVSVDFSSIDFEDVCKEYSNKKDILSLLKKYHSLSIIEKIKRTTVGNQQATFRLDQFSKIIIRQHGEIRKYQSKEKK